LKKKSKVLIAIALVIGGLFFSMLIIEGFLQKIGPIGEEIQLLRGKIAFVTIKDGKPCICLMNVDGSDVRVLFTKENFGISYPAISPDGKRVAFSGTEGASSHLYLLSVKEGKLIQLTFDELVLDKTPAWSPDGKKIAFARAPLKIRVINETMGTYEPGEYDIYIIDADGSNLRRLTTEGGYYPTWSPDGKYIAFTRREGDRYAIWIMNSDGKNQTRLTYGVEPNWSPDGKKIVFTSDSWPRKIGVINLDGSGMIWLTEPPTIVFRDGTSGPATDGFPRWSPDGKKIAFVSNRSGNFDIYTMNADGSEITRLTNNPADDSYPSWSPI
jgi:TolB protein